MGFFSFLKNMVSSFSDDKYQLKQVPLQWYTSLEANREYATIQSTTSMTLFFYKYLLSTCPVFKKASEKQQDDVALRLAWIIAEAVCFSALPQFSWPNVIMPDKNPLIKWLQQPDRRKKDITGIALINAFRGINLGEKEKLSFADLELLYHELDAEQDAFEQMIARELCYAFSAPKTFCATAVVGTAEEALFASVAKPRGFTFKNIGKNERASNSCQLAKEHLSKIKERITNAVENSQREEIQGDIISQLNQIAELNRQNSLLLESVEEIGDCLSDWQSKEAEATRAKVTALDKQLHKKLSQSYPKICKAYCEPLCLYMASATGSGLGNDLDYSSYYKRGEEWSSKVSQISYRDEQQRFISECAAFEAVCIDLNRTTIHEKQEALSKFYESIMEMKRSLDVAISKANLAIAKNIHSLSSQKTLHTDYVDLAGEIARIMETGRASTLQDALNLAIADSERRDASRKQQELLEERIYQEQEAQRRMEQLQRERADEERRWHDEQIAATERAQKAAEDAAKQQRWAAEADARRARDAYYRAKKEYDSASFHYRGAVNTYGPNSQDALRHKANMDKAMADMINSGYSG